MFSMNMFCTCLTFENFNVEIYPALTPIDVQIPATKRFRCETCNKFLATRRSLIQHRRQHTGEVYVCDTCGQNFKTDTGFGKSLAILRSLSAAIKLDVGNPCHCCI